MIGSWAVRHYSIRREGQSTCRLTLLCVERRALLFSKNPVPRDNESVENKEVILKPEVRFLPTPI